ncbi:MAG: HlyC/CorC family transporter [Planctomycetes bacterium]|nr:HlyC/CorC family transporter [Planctomycetota bacterium]
MWPLVLCAAVSLAVALLGAVALQALRSLHRLREAAPAEPAARARYERLLADPDSLRVAAALLKCAGQVGFLFCACLWAFSGVENFAWPQWEQVDRWLLAPLFCIVALVLFGELLPPTIAAGGSEHFARRALPLLHVVRSGLAPALKLLNVLRRSMLRVVNVKERTERSMEIAEEIYDVVSDSERADDLDAGEREMIESVVELRATEVSEIMTPRTEIIGVPANSSLREASRLASDSAHSRMPVFDETIDRVTGVFFTKDLLPLLQRKDIDLDQTPVGSIARKPWFLPETKKVHELLQDFRREKQHMALILDEYGGTAGLVTLEDVLEEIVGPIQDEYDQDEVIESFRRLEDGRLEVDASMSVFDANEELGLELPESEDFDTLGGFVFSSLGKVPAQGERFDHAGIGFEVLEADERRILRLRITPPASANVPSHGHGESALAN